MIIMDQTNSSKNDFSLKEELVELLKSEIKNNRRCRPSPNAVAWQIQMVDQAGQDMREALAVLEAGEFDNGKFLLLRATTTDLKRAQGDGGWSSDRAYLRSLVSRRFIEVAAGGKEHALFPKEVIMGILK